jgi:predicted component of type VI protein secretion system
VDKFCPEAFLKACGATGRLGLLVEQEGRDQDAGFWFLQQPFALVGRNKGNDIILNDGRISRRHAYVQILGGEVFCVDLNSRTGTHWQEGSRPAGWLAPMQSVRLGSCGVRLLGDRSDQPLFSAVDPLAGGSLQQPLVTLEFQGDRWQQTRWPMNRMLALLGSAPCCKVRLHGPQVARTHASLVCTAQGSWVVDLLSPTGTWLNGQKVRLARLEDGDELRIDHFVMRIHCRPSDGFALGSARAAEPVEAAKNGFSLHGQITKMELGPPEREFAQDALVHKPQAVQNVVEHTAKAMLETVFFPMVQQFSAVQNQMFDQFQQAMTLMFQMFDGLQKDQMQLIRAELTRVQELTQEIQVLHTEMKKAPVAVKPDLSLTNHRVFAETSPTNGISPKTVPQGPGETPGQTAEDVHGWLCQRMAELQDDRRSRLQKITDFLSGK